MKYANEVRFCFDAAIVANSEGKEEGVRAKAFDYSGNRITSIIEERDFFASELSRKKNLKPGDEGYNAWVVCARVSGALYLNNDVCMVSTHHLRLMSGIGDQTRKKLASFFSLLIDI